MSTGHLPNQSLGKTRALAFSLRSNIKLSPPSSADSSEYFSQGQPPLSTVVPSGNQDQFPLRIPSPHPELSPPQDARSRSWSGSSSSNLTASSSFVVPSRELGPQTRGSSQYFTPAGSLRSWSSLQPPLLQSNSSQVSGGVSAPRPRGSPARRSAETGYFGTAASVLSSLFTPVTGTQALGHSSIQRRYTEDWVLQRGYQQHRRSDSSLYTELSGDPGSDKDIYFGAHCRNPSNAKTITPADFQSERFLVVPEAELSSDAETGTSEGGAWKTAPQSLIGSQLELQHPPMPMLASRWANTPPIMENNFGKGSGVSDIRVEQEHPNSDLSVFGVVENGLGTTMIRTSSSSTETTATHTPRLNGISASLLPQTPIQISRSNTPNIKQTKRWKGKNVVIQIPSDTPWRLPLEEGGRLMPLTNKQMEEKMREHQEYTAQFPNGQSRDVYPEEVGEKVKDIPVSIPNRKEWEDYCDELREKKLRALGVALSEEAPATTPAATRGQTPLSHHQSPAPYQANPFSPPQPTQSAMSNGMGGHNGNQSGNGYLGHHYSPSVAQAAIHGPVAHMPSPAPAPAFHMPRQSMSMSTTPINTHEWDLYNYTPPPQNHPTPPMMNGSSVWSPGPFVMRNGSPMGGMGHHSHHSHSPSMFTPQYLIEDNQDYTIHNEYVENQRAYYGHNHHHSLVGMDRFHQQQIRRGSPLAQVGHPIEEVEDQTGINIMAIDAPVPKHRHRISISLQKDMEGMENYQKEIETHIGNAHHLSNVDGFNTNPVSSAPEAMYPQHPDIPNVESDVHNGPELLSNPDEDVSDVETERRQNQQAARERTQNIGMNDQQYDNTSLSMSEAQIPVHQYIPQQQYQPHSRDTSLSHIQNQYDAVDPRENSALSMLMAGTGMGTGSRLGGRVLDELLSEDGRTNISDIMTNPSEPPSPRPKYSTSHMHNVSNNSNSWMSDTSKPPGSTTSSTTKFNAQAKEFKFNPSGTFKYSPQSKPFVPGSASSSPIGSTPHSRNVSQEPVGFGGFGFGKGKLNVAAAPFRPSLFSGGSASSVFAKGAAAFSPDAPEFKPKSASSVPPPPPTAPASTNPLPPIFSPTDEATLPASEKTSPISRPSSRLNVHTETLTNEVDDDAREGSVSGGGGKRAKHGPTSSLVKDTEVPALESLCPSEGVETTGINAAESHHPSHDILTEETAAESNVISDKVEEVLEDLRVEKEPLVTIEEGESKTESDYVPYEFRNSEEAIGLSMTDTNTFTAPSERDTSLDALRGELSVEEPGADTPTGSRSERSSTPPQPTAQDFDFDFSQPAKPTSPIEAKLNGMGESRYSHTPSPPPSHPAPPPPVLPNMPSFEPPEDLSPYNESADPYKTSEFGETASRPMPTDSELDDIIRHLDQGHDGYSEPEASGHAEEEGREEEKEDDDEEEEEEEEEEEDVIPWKRDTPKRPAIPLFREPTPTPLQDPFEQAERSAGPSPSPRRPYRHRASSFSPDEDAYGRAQTTSEVAYQPPTQEDIGHGQADSDWDDMIEEGDDTKLLPRSRLFFDTHVEEFVGDLLHSRLGPIHKSLEAIHVVLKGYSLALGRRGSVATSAVHSDADDEDDTQPPRSPKKDKKSEKIKSAVVEALVMHNWSAPTEDKLAEIYGAIAKVSRAFQDSNLNDDLAETKTAILSELVKTAHTDEIDIIKQEILTAIRHTAKATDMEELQSSFTNSVSKIAQVEDIASIRETMEDIFKDAVQTGDIVNMKLELRDALIKTAQKIDVEEVKKGIAEILSKVTHKEDLDHFQNIAIDIFSKVVKTTDLVELKNTLSEVLGAVHSTDVKGEVQKLSHESASFRQTLAQVLKLTQENTENIDFHQESQEGFIRQNHTDVKELLGTIQSSVVEVHRGTEDMRRSLDESDQHFAGIKTAIGEVNRSVEEVAAHVPNLEGIRLAVGKISDSQPTLVDIKDIFVEVAKGQPTLEEVKSVVEEVTNKQPTIEELRFVVEEVASNQPRLSDVKAVMEEVTEDLPKMDALRSMMEELLAKHQTIAVTRVSEQINTEELQLRMEGLEKLLGEADKRAEAESQARRESHEKSLELESRLRIAEEEAARYRDKAEESDRRLKAIDDKRHQALTQTQMRSALLEGAHSSLQKSVGDLSARNASLEGSLREAQQASERHMEEANRVEDENRELRRVIESLKAEMEESIRVREGFRGKFDKLQGDMQTAAYEIGQEQGKWRKIQEEQKARIEVLDARVAAEITMKEGFESEVRRLEVEQKEAIKLKVEFEQVKRSNAKLEELVDKFREEAVEHSQHAAVLTHEVESARESARDEVTRVRESLQRDIDAANTEVNAVRASLEREIEQARYEVERVVREATGEKEQFKLLLEEAISAKSTAIGELEETKAILSKESTESKSTVLQEQHHKYERQLSELRQQVEDTRSQHDRALRIATEDGEREQYFLNERLNISQSESKYLREHITHLKEQVKVATAAAQAAAQAAQSVTSLMAPQPNQNASEEKALRESVDVLQEQLQQREARIDELEHQLSKFDKADIKRKDEQITWLRELLEVRIDELEEIVHSLSLPHFDRESVRDTALRLRANLQMEQREKEMSMSISREITPVASLASRLPGVANSAASWWNSKNKGPSSVAQSSTPSRPTSSAGFLNGILAPPTTLANAQRIGSRLARGISSETASNSSQNTITSRQRDRQVATVPSYRADRGGSRRGPPPQLFRRGSYDADADANDSILSGEFYEDEDNAIETGVDDGDMVPYRPNSYRH